MSTNSSINKAAHEKTNPFLFFSILFISTSHAQHAEINICDEENSYHPIDEQLFARKDSLKNLGIDSILIYRHWRYRNGFNGYGKLIWVKNRKILVQKVLFHNGSDKYGFEALEVRELHSDSAMNFYFEKRVDTLTDKNPKPFIQMTHDASHFLEFSYQDITYCFALDGAIRAEHPNYFKSQWINLLADEKDVIRVLGRRTHADLSPSLNLKKKRRKRRGNKSKVGTEKKH
ncbi:MAG: hypothetical protein MRZ79_19770 [Bacteroidia bacterium]|nr:hypothetical protein [Bacteroidia bacterium]